MREKKEGDLLCCFILHNWALPIWTRQRWKPIRKPAKRSAPAAWAKKPSISTASTSTAGIICPTPPLSTEAEQSVGQLKRAADYLAKKPELAKELSAAERRKRAQLQSKPVYKYVALIISLLGVVSAAYGIQSILNHTGNYGIYFALFGFAAIFLFSSYNMMPTAHNNHKSIMARADKAEAAMAEYIRAYPGGSFPVPDIYAHPVVLKQMTDAIQEGRAVTLPEALAAVKNRLKEVNADVQVEQEEYDEIVQIKAMFLNHDYQ